MGHETGRWRRIGEEKGAHEVKTENWEVEGDFGD